ncbi:hypothetical protein HELRODRAFT_182108 [Helobdella robusta]|uniref:Uncharacterized protein n=1 Tax=Helobdella robusta TaxID=6412 RepID=T1FHR7_HELRO|nr:hypothetical protein HELRODRAFT_182108 [Helobdella robusta]ESN91251.1 hypothetical protein HELRODRAFT_182108 [Helobdella robusta]
METVATELSDSGIEVDNMAFKEAQMNVANKCNNSSYINPLNLQDIQKGHQNMYFLKEIRVIIKPKKKCKFNENMRLNLKMFKAIENEEAECTVRNLKINLSYKGTTALENHINCDAH